MNATTLLPQLPSIQQCQQRLRAAAMLDAMIMPEWEYRYYSYNAHWDAGEEMASMRDGEGDHYFALFTINGLMIKIFEGGIIHPHMQQGMQAAAEQIPESMTHFLSEPAFITEEVTCLLWRERTANHWHAIGAEEEAGSEWFRLLLEGAAYYHTWAKEYYEIELDYTLVERIFQQEPLTRELAEQLNNELEWAELQEDIAEIRYPLA
ncbi:hypothetical protein [Paenibacillus wenxiniae]|uniref:Uncharacterized protein n=1 Tax=Paenibacillus wenxiniae TaxID=1636843 RepID=A0ABW4RQU2_9BACL